MKLNFYRVAAKSNAKGLAPVWCRITHNNNRANISLEIFIEPGQWDNKTQRVIFHPLADNYNNAIVQLQARAFDAYQTLKRKNSPITADAIKQFTTAQTEAVTFIQVIEQYKAMKEAETKAKTITTKAGTKTIAPVITVSTYKGISHKAGNMIKFLRSIKKSNLLISELRPDILDKYRYWLQNTLGSNSHQYANKCLYLWQGIERYAYGLGYIDRLNLLTYTVAKGFAETYDEVPHVTEIELQRIINYTPGNITMQKVKDLFLLQCFTGMAYVDSQLYSDELIHTIEGIEILKYYRAKLRKQKALATPLLFADVKEITARYNGKAPKLPNQTYNEWLKILQAACSIDTLLTSHVGRKTFGMRMLNTFGFKMEEVSRMLGHSSVKMTEKVYAKVTIERVLTAAYSNNIAA